MNTLYARFGLNIRKYRKAMQMSQEELALLAGIGRPTIASIEKGRQAVTLHQAMLLCKVLEVELSTLISILEEKNSSPDLLNLNTVLHSQDFEILEQLHGELT